MPRQGLLIFSVMLIVFSLTLMGGGSNYMFIMSPNMAGDRYVQITLFWLGTLVALIGLAGLLAGLVGVMGVILVRVAEMKALAEKQEALAAEAENTEQEAR